MNDAAVDALTELAYLSDEIVNGKLDRDDLILRAHSEGATLREIAAAASMTHQGVAKLIKRKLGNV